MGGSAVGRVGRGLRPAECPPLHRVVAPGAGAGPLLGRRRRLRAGAVQQGECFRPRAHPARAHLGRAARRGRAAVAAPPATAHTLGGHCGPQPGPARRDVGHYRRLSGHRPRPLADRLGRPRALDARPAGAAQPTAVRPARGAGRGPRQPAGPGRGPHLVRAAGAAPACPRRLLGAAGAVAGAQPRERRRRSEQQSLPLSGHDRLLHRRRHAAGRTRSGRRAVAAARDWRHRPAARA